MSKAKIDLISIDLLKQYIETSKTFSEVAQKIGYSQITDNNVFNRIKKKCLQNNISFQHLSEEKINKERVFPSTIICKKCGIEQPYTNFYISNNKIRHVCKECVKKEQKEKYNKIQQEKENFKKQFACEKCGEKRFYLLDFHHVNAKDKKYTISNQSNTKLKTLLPEINKCITLCANCHREFHYFEKEYQITIQEYLKK